VLVIRIRHPAPVVLYRPAVDADDLWETHADWWVSGFTGEVDPEYEEQILPLAAEHLSLDPPLR